MRSDLMLMCYVYVHEFLPKPKTGKQMQNLIIIDYTNVNYVNVVYFCGRVPIAATYFFGIVFNKHPAGETILN